MSVQVVLYQGMLIDVEVASIHVHVDLHTDDVGLVSVCLFGVHL